MFSCEWVWVIIFINIAAFFGGGALFLFYRNEKKRLGESGNKDGKICVLVSPGDYRKIREPVTFEELCIKLAESIEISF